MGTILVGAIVAGGLFLAARSVYRKKKNGGGCCGCSGGCCGCAHEHEQTSHQ